MDYNTVMSISEFSRPITNPGGLKRLVKTLANQPNIAVDTESNSLFAYREQVCLIQFSTSENDYLLDSLTLTDLEQLGPIFADPHILKIFHAAEYDLLCLKRDFGFSFKNLFDTMVAARILGRKEVGLGSLIEAEYGIQLEKRHQRANWGQRPLPDYLLDYARMDTHFLISLKEKLERELKLENLLPLAQEDFNRLCQVEITTNNGKTDCWRINGVHHISPQQAAVLQQLCIYRDEIAKQLNRPLFKVISDHTLYNIANNLPDNLDKLNSLPGMTNRQMKRHGKALLQAVQRGLQAEPVYPQRNMRPDDRFLARVEALKQWRKQKAHQMRVESDIILPRDMLNKLASKDPRDMQELSVCLSEVPWRFQHYGEEILKTLEKVKNKK